MLAQSHARIARFAAIIEEGHGEQRHQMSIFFYKADGPYGCFSNFSAHPFHLWGYCWSTSEHYYQAHKYVGTPYAALCDQIREAPSPDAAATLGRDPQYAVRPDWETVKLQVMYTAVLTKFLSHVDIRAVLLGTGNELIVEDSPTDAYWGWGANQQGHNYLGKLLMQVREQFRLPKPIAPQRHPGCLSADHLAKRFPIPGPIPEQINPESHR